jgi:hypothetical protein
MYSSTSFTPKECEHQNKDFLVKLRLRYYQNISISTTAIVGILKIIRLSYIWYDICLQKIPAPLTNKIKILRTFYSSNSSLHRITFLLHLKLKNSICDLQVPPARLLSRHSATLNNPHTSPPPPHKSFICNDKKW